MIQPVLAVRTAKLSGASIMLPCNVLAAGVYCMRCDGLMDAADRGKVLVSRIFDAYVHDILSGSRATCPAMVADVT